MMARRTDHLSDGGAVGSIDACSGQVSIAPRLFSKVNPVNAPALRQRRTWSEHTLIGVELFTGVTGVTGGLLLVARPDGSFLMAELSALSGTPFTDWRLPGVFLATLVGGVALLAAFCLVWRAPRAPELSLVYGLGLLAFEVVEWIWIGFQPLQAVFALVALAIAILAWRLRSAPGQPVPRIQQRGS